MENVISVFSTDQQMQLDGSFLLQDGTESFPNKEDLCQKFLICRSTKAHFTLRRHLYRCRSLANSLLQKDTEEPGQGKSACWGCPGGEGCGSLESDSNPC